MHRHSLPTAMRWRVVFVVFLLAFITIVNRVCIAAAKLPMAADLRLTDLQFGWVFGVFAIGYAVAMIPSGWLGDQVGPRVFLAVIVCGWALLTAGTGLVRGLASLITIRLLFGLAEAGVYPTATKAVYEWTAVSERASALGLLNGGSRLGAALGLGISSYVVLWLGWRACFWALGGVALAWAIGWYFWYRDDPAQKHGVSADELAYIRCSKAREPLFRETGKSWPEIVFSWSGCLLLFQYFANNFALFLMYSWALPYLQHRFHMQPGRAGIYAGLPMYCGIVATCAGGLVVDFLFRRGYANWSRAIPALAAFGVATGGLLFAGAAVSPGWLVFWFCMVVLGLDFSVSSSWTVCSDLGREHTGVVSGAMNMMGAVGSFACSLAFPYALRFTDQGAGFFWLAAALNVVAIGCWVVLGCRLSRPEEN